MLSSLERVTAPDPIAAVALDDQKTHSRVDFSADDTILQSYIDAAADWLDGVPGELGRAIMPQVWDYRITGWASRVPLPLPPTRSIVEIAYLHAAGGSPSETVVDAADYRLLPGTPGGVWFKDTFDWPALIAEPQNVRIRMNAGYADIGSVPPMFKQLIRLLAENSYANRSPIVTGTSATELPLSAQALINRLRVYR